MNRLTKLANKFGTDKGTKYQYRHSFTEFYEPYFRKYDKPTILELGTGTGASAKMLNAYYDGDCEIYTVDISDVSNVFTEYDNIHTYIADLGDEYIVQELINGFNGLKFDIIIDDASHQFNDQYLSLIYFRHCLKDGGIFVMEDLHTSYCATEFTYSPLAFLVNLRRNGYFANEDEYNDFVDSIDDIIIYNHRNDDENIKYNFRSRSVTSIITFLNN